MVFSKVSLCVAISIIVPTMTQQPDMIHLSLSGLPNQMVVDFVSHGQLCGPNNVYWSTVPFSPDDIVKPPPADAMINDVLPDYDYKAGFLEAGDDLYSTMMTVDSAAQWCTSNSSCAGFTFSSTDPLCNNGQCNIYFKSAVAFAPSSTWQTYVKPGPPINNVTSTFFPYMNATLGPIGCMQTALMTNLQPNTLYYYVAGNDTGGWSPLKYFINEPVRENGNIWAIFADFGMVNDESLVKLYADAENRAFDYVAHVGDFAYNFDDLNGERGNEFMRAIDGYASLYPVMPTPGNHESHFNYSQYMNRFYGVAVNAGKNSGSGSNIYYSFDQGLVHFIMFSTEVYWSMEGAVEAQLNWMKQDLIKANNNRQNVPWIVAGAHKGALMDTTYCSNATNCYANGTWFDDLLQEYGVDLYFVGHLHQYVKFLSAYPTRNLSDTACASPDYHTYSNCKYTTTFIVGSPGNQEVQPSSCGGPTPNNNLYPVAACSQNYGYSYLQVHNATHATVVWNTSVPIAGSPDPFFSDYVTFIMDEHGPRKF